MTSTGGDVEPLENLLPCYIELLDKHVKGGGGGPGARRAGGGGGREGGRAGVG